MVLFGCCGTETGVVCCLGPAVSGVLLASAWIVPWSLSGVSEGVCSGVCLTDGVCCRDLCGVGCS